MSTVREVMTEVPVTVPPEASVLEAAQLMRSRDIGTVLVGERGNVRGLVTDRDLVLRVLADGSSPDTSVTVACTAQLVTVGADEEQSTAVELMRRHKVRRLPVVDGSETVGVVSLGDLAAVRDPGSALGEISAAAPNPNPPQSSRAAFGFTKTEH